MAWTKDPGGIDVELTDERWEHVLQEHPELADNYHDLLKAIGDPAREGDGAFTDERWYFTALPGGWWLKVCVAYTPNRALRDDRLPREETLMTLSIGPLRFDHVSYDREADVLYVRRGDASQAVDFDESPEGHHLRFNAEGDLVGITFVNAQGLIEREGELKLSLPPLHVAPEAVASALG